MKILALCFFSGLVVSLVFSYYGVNDVETEAYVALFAALPFGVMLLEGRLNNG